MDAPNIPESTIEDLDVRDDAPDGLEFLIQHDIDRDPGFAEAWAPLAVVRKILDERRRLGLSQAEVAARMGVARTAVVRLENDPTKVAFGRVMAYARAVGVELAPKPSPQPPKPAPIERSRRITV